MVNYLNLIYTQNILHLNFRLTFESETVEEKHLIGMQNI